MWAHPKHLHAPAKRLKSMALNSGEGVEGRGGVVWVGRGTPLKGDTHSDFPTSRCSTLCGTFTLAVGGCSSHLNMARTSSIVKPSSAYMP
jgi:hypothetical protein